MSKGGSERTPVKKRDWIAEHLEMVPVVEWDRFVVGERDGYQYVDVYGWIEREEDEYKDFVWVRFWPSNETIDYTTSSDTYSEYLTAEWFGEDALDGHNECRRVEHAFDIENAIELHDDQSLDAYTDGGIKSGSDTQPVVPVCSGTWDHPDAEMKPIETVENSYQCPLCGFHVRLEFEQTTSDNQ